MKHLFAFSISALIIAVIGVCRSSPHQPEFREETAGGAKVAMVACPGWKAVFPGEWEPVFRGTTHNAGVIQLSKKSAPGNSSVTRPSCLLACEIDEGDVNLKEYVIDKFTKITARMIRSGYAVERTREEYITEITAGIGDKTDVAGFAYELTAPSSLKKNRLLAIALFANKKDSIFSLTFEMDAAAYPFMKKEIIRVVKSLGSK